MTVNEDLYGEEQPVKGRGRPGKGYVNFHTSLPEETKLKIDQLAAILNCSQGEVVTAAMKVYLASFKTKT